MAKKRTRSRPQHVDDAVLGLVQFVRHLNPQMDEYETTVKISGQSVEFSLYSNDQLDISPTIKRARELVRRHGTITKRINAYLGKNQLKEYNDVWRLENESRMTKQQLIERVQLTTITVHADGTASYWFDDGDIFEGHCIVLDLDSNTQLVDSSTPG